MSRLVVVLGLLALTPLVGCDDPCTELARRICNCEPNSNARYTCTANRITNQQGRVEINDADKAFCSEKLDTCTCASMDENRLDECGFVVDDNADTSGGDE
ncbi:MAG TPA: hypothetical protein VGF99_19165 [Myxococcota bacterium]